MITHGHFSISISIGNTAVQDSADIADILYTAARKVESTSLSAINSRSIALYDANGNTVGHASITGYSEDSEDD